MGSRDKVLIVDDSELDRIALKKMLKDAYEIVEAVDGAGALRILESQKEFDAISAIILDLVMPQMDGFEFLREYRKVDSYRRIPVIVASVERDVKTEKACLALGARDFIGKPYDPQIVRFRVENAVRSSEQQLSRELRYLRIKASESGKRVEESERVLATGNADCNVIALLDEFIIVNRLARIA